LFIWLILALEALKLPRSSDVLVPSLTFVRNFNAILHYGLIPIFVDVKLDDHNISIEKMLHKTNLNWWIDYPPIIAKQRAPKSNGKRGHVRQLPRVYFQGWRRFL